MHEDVPFFVVFIVIVVFLSSYLGTRSESFSNDDDQVRRLAELRERKMLERTAKVM